MNKWQPHCVICGRFVPYDADYGTPFGSARDLEPPDPEYYCEPCIETQKELCRNHGWVPSDWMPADWHYEIAEELGFVRVGPKGAAWSVFIKPSRVPNDWEERRMHEHMGT